MYLSFATVYQLAAHGDSQAALVCGKLRDEPGLIPYVRNGRMGVERLPVRGTHAPIALAGQLVGATALVGYVLAPLGEALLALS